MKQVTRSLLLVVVASATLVSASQHRPIRDPAALRVRAGIPLVDSSSGASPQSSTSAAAATTTEPAATSAAATSVAPTSAASPSPVQTQPSSTSPAKETTNNASSAPPQTPQAPATSVVATTNAAGEVFTSIVTLTPSSTTAAPSPTSNPNSSDSDSGLSTGSIIGLSVSGGIAALAIILFFVWKFTRKRFSDFDDNEAIKWPELNAHNNDVHALPTNSTGRAGFGLENDSDINLTRAPSPGGAYAGSIAASSVPEAYGAGDPYAVPPLPHLNPNHPNQPYPDEPGAYGQPAGFYDPYRGPVPNTFTDPMSDGHGAESIQMTRMRSPGPQVAYDMQGRGSPAPQAAMDYAGMDERSRTPVPGAVLGTGRASPGPYGYGPR